MNQLSSETVNALIDQLKGKESEKEPKFHTDFPQDRFLRWLSTGVPLLLALTLQANSLLSTGAVKCLPEDGLVNYTSSYSLPFATNADDYCGTLMKEFVGPGEEKQLYQHYFPICLAVQALLNAFPYVLWHLFAVDDVIANLRFIKDDMETSSKNNFEEVRRHLSDESTGRKTLVLWCEKWVESEQNIVRKYVTLHMILPLIIQVLFVIFYGVLLLDIDPSLVKFRCSLEGKITLVCILITGNLFRLFYWLNAASILLSFFIALFKWIYWVFISNQGRKEKIPDFFFSIGMERPQRKQSGCRLYCVCSNDDFDFMSMLSYTNISKMTHYHNYVVEVKTIRDALPVRSTVETENPTGRQNPTGRRTGRACCVASTSQGHGENEMEMNGVRLENH